MREEGEGRQPSTHKLRDTSTTTPRQENEVKSSLQDSILGFWPRSSYGHRIYYSDSWHLLPKEVTPNFSSSPCNCNASAFLPDMPAETPCHVSEDAQDSWEHHTKPSASLWRPEWSILRSAFQVSIQLSKFLPLSKSKGIQRVLPAAIRHHVPSYALQLSPGSESDASRLFLLHHSPGSSHHGRVFFFLLSGCVVGL